MRSVIIGNGDFNNSFDICGTDYIICADGGYNHAVKYGIKPDIVIGDMDSVRVDINDEDTVVYPTEKDFTDSELAVRMAIDKGCDEIILLGMTGTRLDHTLANICLLKYIHQNKKTGIIIDKNNKIYYIDKHMTLSGLKGKTVSLIPINGDLCGVSNSGFYYPLHNETVYFGTARGVSNVVMCDKADITISKGEGIVIITDGE